MNYKFFEKTTPFIDGFFEDKDNAPIVPTALTLTIFESQTKAIVNSRNQYDLTASIASLVNATTGYFQYVFATSDTALVRTDLNEGDVEEHVIRFDFTWDSGNKSNSALAILKIKNTEYK